MRQVKSVDEIKVGDVLVNRGSGTAYVCTGHLMGWPILVNQLTATNATEWLKEDK